MNPAEGSSPSRSRPFLPALSPFPTLERSNDLREPGNEPGAELLSPAGMAAAGQPFPGEDRVTSAGRGPSSTAGGAAEPCFELLHPLGPPGPGATCSSQKGKPAPCPHRSPHAKPRPLGLPSRQPGMSTAACKSKYLGRIIGRNPAGLVGGGFKFKDVQLSGEIRGVSGLTVALKPHWVCWQHKRPQIGLGKSRKIIIRRTG